MIKDALVDNGCSTVGKGVFSDTPEFGGWQ